MQPWKDLFGSSSATVGSQTQVKKKKNKAKRIDIQLLQPTVFSPSDADKQTRTVTFGCLKLRLYELHL